MYIGTASGVSEYKNAFASVFQIMFLTSLYRKILDLSGILLEYQRKRPPSCRNQDHHLPNLLEKTNSPG
jgi:hypothetical protein